MSSSSLARYDANVLLAAVAALSGAVAFVAALHLYARCLLQRRVAVAEANPRVLVLRRPPPDGHELEAGDGGGACGRGAAGMDAKALRALPVFVWEGGAAAAEHDGQCAVCLGEMEDGELGRLLPACRHAFHVECIDTWLGVCSTCPVCRTVAAAAAVAAAAPAAADVAPDEVEPVGAPSASFYAC
ncbi:unnamed protein product [Urochloa decumbens]|uniref:RING-type domain-containing protein n=1 Tax=Urochloa decumbens TaxID=240449 RepID=A0ABC8W4T6_9POAL